MRHSTTVTDSCSRTKCVTSMVVGDRLAVRVATRRACTTYRLLLTTSSTTRAAHRKPRSLNCVRKERDT